MIIFIVNFSYALLCSSKLSFPSPLYLIIFFKKVTYAIRKNFSYAYVYNMVEIHMFCITV